MHILFLIFKYLLIAMIITTLFVGILICWALCSAPDIDDEDEDNDNTKEFIVKLILKEKKIK